MKLFLKSVAAISFLFVCHINYAQRGPGGVSTEIAGPDSDCKMWLDAGSIGAADGAPINSWNDESLSAINNSPFQATPVNQPIYRNDPAESINGEPILRFVPNRFFEVNSSVDINTSSPNLSRTTLLAFRTGADVTTRQMLWEQGGNVRGLNIFIFNNFLWFGGYDLQVDADGAPAWGYVFTRVPISPSTPYVVSHVFEGDPDGNPATNDGTIYGYLNGELFVSIDPVNGVPASPVGSLWSHPNEPGLGAVNGQSYNELGPVNTGAGSQPFLGDMSEFIGYGDILNDAERIIVENYLGAKYFANLTVNDYFDHQVNHGKEVIGIGQENDGGAGLVNHNISQARNLFQIQAAPAEFDGNATEYFLIGNNDADLSSWTVSNAPNLGVKTRRITREWRADHSGDLGDITVTLDANDLPALPAGFTKICLVIDPSNGATSDFNQASTQILEMTNTAGTTYEITTTIPDGAYITFAAVDPEVYFTNATQSGFELTGVGVNNPMTVEVSLNYIPATTVNVGYANTDNTATEGVAPANDYDNITPAVGAGALVFTPGNQKLNISFDIMGDSNPESTEDFTFTINASGTTAGIDIGAVSTHTFVIYDDDNIPKIGFNVITSSHPENAGAVTVEIVRSGSTVAAASCDYRLRIPGGSGTATDVVDYTYVQGTANFPIGATSFMMPVSIVDDLLDEPNETIIFELYNNVNADLDAGFTEHTLTIIDNDSPPTVQFAIVNSQGPEPVGLPQIAVILSGPSTQTVSINYVDNLTGTATSGADYTIAVTNPIIFMPGDTVEYLPLVIVNDGLPEPDETIDFSLNGATISNATLGVNTTHTYTIKDYSSFEWTGAAGVGQAVDNILWLKAGLLPDADGANVQDFLDSSPNGNVVNQTVVGNQANMNFAGPNGEKELVFNGTSDVYDINDDANINTNTFYTAKHIWVVFTAGTVGNRQMIYEQGGGTRGISIYLDTDSRAHFNIWSNNDDNGANSAWGVGSATGAVHVAGTTPIVAGQTYIAVLEYTIDATNTGTLEGYINGVSQGTSTVVTGSGVPPRLYTHGDNGGIGGVIGGTRYHDNSGAQNYFDGSIQEVIHFTDAPVNTARRVILDNHLSSKYNVTLGANQFYNTAYSGTYQHEVAGIGQANLTESHTDARGTAIVRINQPSSLDPGDYLIWGHDSVKYTHPAAPVAWTLPPGVDNALHRVWRVSELGGDVGTVNVRADLSQWTIGSGADIVMMIDSDDGDFANATVIPATSVGGSEAFFANINFNNGQWFTFASLSNLNPLPIELLSFVATPVNGVVDLRWTTASESNNDYFTVERSKDGLVWEDIIYVDGAGNSSSMLSYSSEDNSPYSGTSFYRLKQTDFDGSYSYSDIRMVRLEDGEEDVLIYPNPNTNGELNVALNGLENAELSIIDLNGKLVFNKNYEASSQLIRLNHNLSAGIYMLTIKSEYNTITKKLVVR